MPLDDAALGALFRDARTHNAWTDQPVSDDDLRAVFDLMKWGPTSANCSPARFVFVRSPDGEAAAQAGALGRQPRQDPGRAGDRDRRL